MEVFTEEVASEWLESWRRVGRLALDGHPGQEEGGDLPRVTQLGSGGVH